MPVLASKLSPRSEDFKANASAMRALVDDLNAKLAQVVQGGGEGPRAKHIARGKLLPRDRVETLLDPDTPFLELAPLAASSSGCSSTARPCGRSTKPTAPAAPTRNSTA